MAYADQSMSGNKVTALIIVALIHVVLVYALVTGLAFSAYKKAVERVTTIDIEEEVKKEEPPPPPPKKQDVPPPITKIVVPPAPTVLAPPQAPVLDTTPIPLPPPPPPPPLPPPPAPPPVVTAKKAVPRGNPGNWATTDDYPARALREERAGVTGFRVTIGTDGRITDCQVTSSSGHPDLDEATCTNVRRRGRFTPAVGSDGQPTTDTYSNRIRWVIPKD